MVESDILVAINSMLTNLKENSNNARSAPMFKKVIANNAPIWSSVEVTPSVCFYLADTEYNNPDGLRYNGTSKIAIYVYNKHQASGLSLKDILTPYISAIREGINKLPKSENYILDAFVSKTSRDGGTILPFTVAEITVEIDFVEAKTC